MLVAGGCVIYLSFLSQSTGNGNVLLCLEAHTACTVLSGIRRDGHLLFEVEMYLQKGCIMVSGVGSS